MITVFWFYNHIWPQGRRCSGNARVKQEWCGSWDGLTRLFWKKHNQERALHQYGQVVNATSKTLCGTRQRQRVHQGWAWGGLGWAVRVTAALWSWAQLPGWLCTCSISADCLAFLFLASQSSSGSICRSGCLSRSSLTRSKRQLPKMGLQHYCCWRKKIVSTITAFQHPSYAFYSISPPSCITKKKTNKQTTKSEHVIFILFFF